MATNFIKSFLEILNDNVFLSSIELINFSSKIIVIKRRFWNLCFFMVSTQQQIYNPSRLGLIMKDLFIRRLLQVSAKSLTNFFSNNIKDYYIDFLNVSRYYSNVLSRAANKEKFFKNYLNKRNFKFYEAKSYRYYKYCVDYYSHQDEYKEFQQITKLDKSNQNIENNNNNKNNKYKMDQNDINEFINMKNNSIKQIKINEEQNEYIEPDEVFLTHDDSYQYQDDSDDDSEIIKEISTKYYDRDDYDNDDIEIDESYQEELDYEKIRLEEERELREYLAEQNINYNDYINDIKRSMDKQENYVIQNYGEIVDYSSHNQSDDKQPVAIRSGDCSGYYEDMIQEKVNQIDKISTSHNALLDISIEDLVNFSSDQQVLDFNQKSSDKAKSHLVEEVNNMTSEYVAFKDSLL